MILRKPYAFLIKRFKIIHLILTICAIYLVTVINDILNYYNNFIDGVVGKLSAVEFFDSVYIWVTIIAIVISFVVMMLMRYKRKSYLFYIVLIAYFLAISFVIRFSIGGLYQIYIASLETKSLLFYRDVLRIVSIFQYIFVFMCLVRGLGFDIKKFNFADDLMELNIDVSDDEEVELTLSGGEKYQRKLHRRTRELKYYYLENKHMINLIAIVIVVAFLGSFLLNKFVLNPVYKSNDVFTFDDFSFEVLETYVTNIGYDNKKISNNGDSFVIVKFNVSSETEVKEINKANLILEVGDKRYASDVVTSKFNDLGISYRNQKIKGNSTYLLIYSVPEVEVNNRMILNFGNEKDVSLKPIYLDKVEKAINYELNDNLDMTNSVYNIGSLKIKSYEIADRFNYGYTYEVLGQIYNGNISIYSDNNVMMNLLIESSYRDGYDNYSFLSKYSKLKYVVNDIEYTSNVFFDKTPGSYRDGIYVAVDKEIINASSIWFDLIVRNKHYIYKLK